MSRKHLARPSGFDISRTSVEMSLDAARTSACATRNQKVVYEGNG
jgi:hypothetical protein